MPHALKVQGGKGGGGGRLWVGGHFPVWLQLVTRSQGMSGLLGSPLPSAGHTGKMQPKGCYGVGCSHSREQAAFPGRQAGNGKEGAEVGRGMGGWRGMRMEAGAPFLEALAPPSASGDRPSIHSLRQSQLPPLPTCPAVPFLQAPSPVPSSVPLGNPLSSHPTSPEGQGSRNGTWAQSTDGMTKEYMVFRSHHGDTLVTRHFRH